MGIIGKIYSGLGQYRTARLIRIIPLLVTLSAFLVLLPLAVQAAEQSPTDEWQFLAEAYFWGASVNGESVSGSDISIDIDDLIDDLNLGFMGALGVRKGKWGFLVDTIYLDVSDNKNVVVDGVGVNTNVDLKGWVVTPMAGYQVYEAGNTNVNVIAGARYLNLSVDVDLRNADPTSDFLKPSISDSGGNWDGIIGIKGDIFLNDHWFIPYYADIGAGNSKFTWQVLGGLGYRFHKSFDVLAAYRYLSWDFDDSDVFEDLNFSGFAAGVRFYF